MDTITIDGREFHGVTQELSAAQDDYLSGHLRLAGALELVAALSESPKPLLPGPKLATSPEHLTEALLTQILVSGRASHVLAGCLTEVGKKWTADEANRNAEIFAQVRDESQKLAMRTGLIGFVLGFFRLATASVATSRRSSSRNSRGPATSPAGRATSAIGTWLSARWPRRMPRGSRSF